MVAPDGCVSSHQLGPPPSAGAPPWPSMVPGPMMPVSTASISRDQRLIRVVRIVEERNTIFCVIGGAQQGRALVDLQADMAGQCDRARQVGALALVHVEPHGTAAHLGAGVDRGLDRSGVIGDAVSNRAIGQRTARIAADLGGSRDSLPAPAPAAPGRWRKPDVTYAWDGHCCIRIPLIRSGWPPARSSQAVPCTSPHRCRYQTRKTRGEPRVLRFQALAYDDGGMNPIGYTLPGG